jgi:aminomethyltransferase
MGNDIKSTLLHEWHEKNGANMAAFGDYDMPLWYPTGVKGEHLAVINSAGLFDTSHMATVTVEGSGARELLQRCFSKDLERCIGLKKTELVQGRSVYGLFLTEKGHVLDDSIVSQVTDTLYMVVVNASMGGPVAERLGQHAGELQVNITDLTDRLGKIDIQGPASAKILGQLLEAPDQVFERFPYFSFKGWFEENVEGVATVKLKDGSPVLLSRTGYTGEFGFEIFMRSDLVVAVWQQLLAIGKETGLVPCGLAARDSLRAGAVLPLSHQDVGNWPFAENPWPFALCDTNDAGKFTKEFLGAEALLEYVPTEFTLPFAGFDPRKMNVSDQSFVADEQGERLGIILTCATDMAVGRVDDVIVSLATPVADGKPEEFTPRGLSCGFVKLTQKKNVGDIVYLTDGKRKIKVEIRDDVRPNRTARRPMKEMV